MFTSRKAVACTFLNPDYIDQVASVPVTGKDYHSNGLIVHPGIFVTCEQCGRVNPLAPAASPPSGTITAARRTTRSFTLQGYKPDQHM